MLTGPKNKRYQLCWYCSKAVIRGCNWSKDFTPVEGWKAEPVIKKGLKDGWLKSYSISECPEFDRDVYSREELIGGSEYVG